MLAGPVAIVTTLKLPDGIRPWPSVMLGPPPFNCVLAKNPVLKMVPAAFACKIQNPSRPLTETLGVVG